MLVGADAQGLQPPDELVRNGLAPVVGEHHAADGEPDAPEGVDQAEGVLVIGDAQVAPALGALDVVGRNGDDDLRLVLHLQQHFDLAVRLEARQDPGGVEIVKELAAELQIQLAELGDPVADPLGLQLYIFCVVKARSVHGRLLPKHYFTLRHFTTVASGRQVDGKYKNERLGLFFFIIICYTLPCIVISTHRKDRQDEFV